MGKRLLYQESGEYFFVTTSFAERKALGNIDGVYNIISKSINFHAEKTNARILAYVLMPSHIHLVVQINGRILSSFMRDFKKFTAQKALSSLQSNGSLWQFRYDRVAIWNDKILLEKMKYIHNNPVKAGLVNEAPKWYWSSAADYLGRKDGPVKVWIEWYE
jgi:putative transposase